MSKKSSKNDDDPVKDVAENDTDDVTEIISVPAPEPDGEGSDATQILPMRKPAKPMQQLPGAVIGVAGARPSAESAAAPTPIEPTDAPSTPGDDEEATKILFNARDDQTPSPEQNEDGTESTPHSTLSEEQLSEGQPAEQSDAPSSQDKGAAAVADPEANQPEGTQPDDSQPESAPKTVFLPPVSKSKQHDDFNPPVGWLVVVEGPGCGTALTINYGQNTIGRGDDQHIQLNFGDTRIARETHAYVVYDEVARTYFVRDAGKKNLVRLNGKPVLAPEQLSSHDRIQIGETTCLFVPLCSADFDWLGGEDDPATGPGEDGEAS